MLSLSLFACAKDMDPPSRVEELRLLAVEADQPFALPGDEVHLRALAFDPAQRALSWGWGVCVDAASSQAVDCLRTLSFESLTIGANLTEHTVLVPDTTAPSVGVAIVLCPGTLSAGTTATMPLRCLDETGRTLDISEFELGLKRIYTRDPALNDNPIITGVLWDGEPWAEGEIKQDSCKKPGAGACSEGVEHKLAAQAPAAAQASTDAKGLAIKEVAVVQYYATAGKFEDEVRFFDAPETKWHARKEDAGKLVTFWFVVRDDRGGVSWTSRQVQAP
jgi:hypothetical protein